MQMADDDGLDRRRLDADRLQALADRFYQIALAAFGHCLVKTGIDHDRAGFADDRPHEEVERLKRIVRVAADKILARAARVVAVANGINFIHVTHGLLPARTSTPARRSSGWTMVVRSRSGPISSHASCSRRATACATSMGTPSAAASAKASCTSFIIKPLVKPRSNVRGNTTWGNLCSVAVLRPVPALITSSMTRGSSPALTPITIASEVAATAVADRKLLASFIVWPAPGCSLMKNTLPNTCRAGSMAAISACGPDAMTASVPFSAPRTPPLTGLSICTMLWSFRAV